MKRLILLTGATRGLGRALVRRLQEIQRGTELMATVHPDHRLAVHSGDEVDALAEEINRMAERVREARGGLETQVEQATRELSDERAKLSAILTELDEGVVVATLDGLVTLANPVAQELLGAPTGSLLGRSLFDFVDREKVAHFLDRLRAGQLENRPLRASYSLIPGVYAVAERRLVLLIPDPGSRQRSSSRQSSYRGRIRSSTRECRRG